MSTQPKLVYLASYPKSGNTWLRIFLGYLMQGSDFNINSLDSISENTASIPIFNEIIGENHLELTEKEISYYRPRVIQSIVKEKDASTFFKTHEAYIKNSFSEWLLPQCEDYKAVYIIRNPLDVSVSYSYHCGHKDFNRTIELMAGEKASIITNQQFSQYLGSWTFHYHSWIDNFNSDQLLVIKYEDMINNPHFTFTHIVNFLALEYSNKEISKAIAHSSFEKLKKHEEEYGFKEKLKNANSFFRKGTTNTWINELTEKQIEKINNDHYSLMKKLNYLT